MDRLPSRVWGGGAAGGWGAIDILAAAASGHWAAQVQTKSPDPSSRPSRPPPQRQVGGFLGPYSKSASRLLSRKVRGSFPPEGAGDLNFKGESKRPPGAVWS